jgi:hypothetical protein
LVFYLYRSFSPAGYGNGIHSQLGSFPADRRMRDSLPPASAWQKAMVSFFHRRSIGFSLYGVNYHHCSSTVIRTEDFRNRVAQGRIEFLTAKPAARASFRILVPGTGIVTCCFLIKNIFCVPFVQER